MSAPGLAELERALQDSVAAPGAGLRARVLAAAGISLREARTSPFARAPASFRERRFWQAGAAAAALLLFNLARAFSFHDPLPAGPPPAQLCEALSQDPQSPLVRLNPSLLRACLEMPRAAALE